MNDLKLNMPPLSPASLDVRPGMETPGSKPSEGVDFTALVKSSIDDLNKVQQHAASLAEKFEVGDPSVDLTRVMVEMQKSRVSFEAVSQVRNKLVEAYREVMNMQV